MKVKSDKFSWLKDSEGVWNYARIIGFVMLILAQPAMIIYAFYANWIPDINNAYQFLIICIPAIVALILFIIEFFRDKNSMKIHFGEFELEMQKGDKNGDSNPTDS
jgi:amino acid permease